MGSTDYLRSVVDFLGSRGWDTSTTQVREGVHIVAGTKDATDDASRMLTMVVEGPETEVTTDHIRFLLEAGQKKNAQKALLTTTVGVTDEASNAMNEYGVDTLSPDMVTSEGLDADTDDVSMPEGEEDESGKGGGLVTRRRLLIGGGIFGGFVVVGALTEDEDDEDPTGATSESSTPTDSSNDDATETDSEEGDGVVFYDDRLEEVDWPSGIGVNLTVENTDSDPTGSVTVEVDWFDEDEILLGSTQVIANGGLRGGETWDAWVIPLPSQAEGDEVANYSIELDVNRSPSSEIDELTVDESNLIADERNSRIEGVVTNNRDEMTDHATAVGRVVDTDGQLLVTGFDSVSDLDSGTDFTFDIRFGRIPVGLIEERGEDYEVTVRESRF